MSTEGQTVKVEIEIIKAAREVAKAVADNPKVPEIVTAAAAFLFAPGVCEALGVRFDYFTARAH